MDHQNTIPAELVELVPAKECIERLEREVLQAVDEKLRRSQTTVGDLLAKGSFDEAEREVGLVERWVPASRRAGVTALRDSIEAAKQARYRSVQALRLPEPLKAPDAIRAKLRSMLKGEGDVILFREGGVHVTFPDGGALLEDVEQLIGPKAACKASRVPGLSGGALRVAAKEAPVLLLVKVPLQETAEVLLKLHLTEEPREDARVALLLGARAGRYKSRGLDWGVVPVEMKANGQLDTVTIANRPALATRQEVVISLSASRGQLRGSLKVGGGPEDRGKSVKARGEMDTVAIYVENAEIYITSLEISGLIDPKPLQ